MILAALWHDPGHDRSLQSGLHAGQMTVAHRGARLAARPREHPQALSDPRRRLQSRADHAPAHPKPATSAGDRPRGTRHRGGPYDPVPKRPAPTPYPGPVGLANSRNRNRPALNGSRSALSLGMPSSDSARLRTSQADIPRSIFVPVGHGWPAWLAHGLLHFGKSGANGAAFRFPSMCMSTCRADP